MAVLLALLGAGVKPVEADAIYSVNRSVQSGFGPVTITGQMVTDGTLGPLGRANFVDWTLTVDSSIGSETLHGPLSGNTSYLFIFGSLSATATGLDFDFSGLGVVWLSRGFISSDTYWCLDNLDSCHLGSGETIGWDYTIEGFTPRTGAQQIATLVSTTVPEPASVLLFAAGALGGALRALRRA
jgi:hypothetical protein